jgi:hypothetical protein
MALCSFEATSFEIEKLSSLLDNIVTEALLRHINSMQPNGLPQSTLLRGCLARCCGPAWHLHSNLSDFFTIWSTHRRLYLTSHRSLFGASSSRPIARPHTWHPGIPGRRRGPRPAPGPPRRGGPAGGSRQPARRAARRAARPPLSGTRPLSARGRIDFDRREAAWPPDLTCPLAPAPGSKTVHAPGYSQATIVMGPPIDIVTSRHWVQNLSDTKQARYEKLH